ncbi:MAG: hypothetical protein JWP40_4025 [Blastococcus sp.]|nr:hypothetical protein [Blastococcus sp.]
MRSQRHDLGESFARLLRAVIALEEPVLNQHDLVMWDYVVLSALGQADAPAQAVLADSVGRDKTRLIPILDRLEARGLVRRDVDPPTGATASSDSPTPDGRSSWPAGRTSDLPRRSSSPTSA